MRYRITHRTEYQYSAPVSECHNVAHLLPMDSPLQRCLSSGLFVDPLPADHIERRDYFGNRVSHFSVQMQHQQLTVTASSEVQTRDVSTELALYSGIGWERAAADIRQRRDPLSLAARQFLLESPLVPLDPQLADYAASSFTPGRPAVEGVLDLMGRIHRDFDYRPGFTTVSTPLAEVVAHRRGVCQDFAHLAIGCLRGVGLPARYVSGYVETLPPPGQPRLIGADASHAWFAVYLPDEGWLEFDPTNNRMPMDQHIAVAYGRDFSDVTPIKGVIFGGGDGHDLNVSVDVERLDY